MPQWNRKACLPTLQHIPKSERPECVRLANQLDVPDLIRLLGLATLQHIPEGERPECVRLVNQLNVSREHRETCLDILRQVPEGERPECVRLANDPNIPNESRIDFLRTRCEAFRLDEEIPLIDIDDSADNIHNIAEHLHSFKVASTSITQDPVATLSRLAENMQNSGAQLRISYEDSGSIDVGGVSRDFVTKLLDALFQPDRIPKMAEMIENGLIVPKFPEKIPEKCYQGLGLIFADALNQEICTGCRFHPILFQMLHSLTNEEIDKVNTKDNKEPYNKILKVYLKSQPQYSKINEKDLNAIDEFVDNGTVPPLIKSLGMTKENFLTETGIDEMIKSTLMIAQYTKQRLTLRNQSWDAVKGNTPDDLREKIEGKLTKADVLSALENQPDAVSNQKSYLEHWILDSTPEQLENFVYAISGSKALPLGKTLRIKDGGDLKRFPEFHTCSYQVNIPNYQDYDTFKVQFETSLVDATQTVMQLT